MDTKNGRRITDHQLITVFKGIDSRLRKLEVLPGQVQQLHKQMGLVVDRLDRLIEEVVRSRTFDAGKSQQLERRVEALEKRASDS
ncbi:MAG: hypothetical protein HYT87_11225 [Nitrospirae bacterium]|nr:hypothetical protein [Nitrospirota bacterium]